MNKEINTNIPVTEEMLIDYGFKKLPAYFQKNGVCLTQRTDGLFCVYRYEEFVLPTEQDLLKYYYVMHGQQLNREP